MSLLERYRAGERDQVWHELRQLGARVRDASYWADADAVACEAMTRARANVETLVQRLGDAGYRFGDPWDDEGAVEPHAPPDEHTPAFVAWLDARWGPIPMTFRAWIEIVGDVSLLGVHPAWPSETVADPLVIEVERKSWPADRDDRASIRRYFENEHETWHVDGSGVFTIDVAPDALHKANISGGAPYGVLVPDASCDAMFRYDESLVVPFIEYLNLAFRWGGFPGLRRGSRGLAPLALRLGDGLLEL